MDNRLTSIIRRVLPNLRGSMSSISGPSPHQYSFVHFQTGLHSSAKMSYSRVFNLQPLTSPVSTSQLSCFLTTILDAADKASSNFKCRWNNIY
jgi:hypothetical protein